MQINDGQPRTQADVIGFDYIKSIVSGTQQFEHASFTQNLTLQLTSTSP